MAIDRKAHRLVECIEAVVGKRMARRITKDLKEPTAGTPPGRKAAWAGEVIVRMDRLLPSDQRREIMERRRCHASNAGIMRNRKLWQECKSLEDFARATRERGWKGYLCEGNTLRMQISSGWCHCSLVRGREAPISKTYCLCCAGHLRHGLEPVFEQPVYVEPISTPISGDKECWFVAHIGGKGATERPEQVRARLERKPMPPEERRRPVREEVRK